ncbi:hypothetical protein IO375_000462 [Campylobacter upsaliensis]|uniref:hypothetical protein n=1 Tax=Campylobacter upsaliensis TaxID=28080 RepID=UPI0012898377|nr:hypothetical protein [Campylobacter upsaliensis]EAH7596982.1 hypothetical protein [Campylobacter upsaliensis]EAI0665099.1 hypothetical protein [Campylobacter upsaliensis]EAI1979640.1 hypothetical protein [Campylobacter upsaliensis]EAI4356678.1 hypothetical protein [Campylobacter upsaliensis]EAI7129181.1 hypothetical protein [Campylobacter upsaliensis]
MKKIVFFVLFLFLSYSALKATDEYCKYIHQQDRAVPLILNYGIRLGVTGVAVANAPAPNQTTRCR